MLGFSKLATTWESVPRAWLVPVALIAVLLLAASVRVVDITGKPTGFFADEAAMGVNAHAILTSGKDEYGTPFPVLFRSFGDYKLGVAVYATVPFVALFGKTELAVRLTGAAFGLLAVVAVYLLASRLAGSRSVGLAAALFLAAAPWHIHYSRTGFSEMLSFLTLLLFGLYAFSRGLDSRGWLIAAGGLLGLTLHTYRSAWIVVPLLVVVLAILYRKELLADRRTALYSLGLMLLVSVPILVHLTTGDGDRAQDAGLLRLDISTWEKFTLFAQQYFSHFNPSFLFIDGDDWAITRHYLPGFGHLYPLQLPLMAIGLAGILLKPTREKVVIAALVLVFPLGGALSDISPISSRSLLGAVAAAMLTGYGLVLLVSGLSRLNRPYGLAAASLAGVAVAIVLAGSLVSYTRHYHDTYPVAASGYWGWQEGPQEIIDYFVASGDSYEQLVMDGEFNGPHIFFRFYAEGECARNRCTTGNPASYRAGTRQLFALRPHNYNDAYEYRTVGEIEYPGGETAFILREIIGPSQ